VIAVESEGLRNAREHQPVVVVGIGIAALHVEQSCAPGVADAAGDRSDAAAVVGVDIAVREGGRDGIAAEPGVLALDADHPVRRELVVEAGLHAAEEARVVVVADDEPAKGVVVAEGGADVAADVEAGPVVDRGGNRRRGLGVGARGQIGSEGRRAESDERDRCEKQFLHFVLVSSIQRRLSGAHPRARC
jgi:hypothetical protein